MKRNLPLYILAVFVWAMGVLIITCLWDSPAPLWQKYTFTPVFLGISTSIVLKIFKLSFINTPKSSSRRYYEKGNSRGDVL